MSSGALAMAAAIVVVIGVAAYLAGTLARAIQNEKKTSMRLWKNFGLSLAFCLLFFITWVAQGIAQWQTYTDQQREHREPVEIGDFVSDFSQATLENWQSEFLQLFSFTIMAAVLIHKGSAESKDSDDRIAASLKRIEESLGTEPTLQGDGGNTDLHVFPDEAQGWQLRSADATEPEGYYDTQKEAVEGGRALARKKGAKLLIHGTDGDVRDAESYGDG